MTNTMFTRKLPLAGIAAALLATTLAGCAPMLVGGAAAVGTALLVTDRRTSGAQIDDEAIELRAGSRLSDAFGDRVHIAVASYNRQVLLTGEVPNEAIKQQAEQIVARVDNVRNVINELAILPPTSLPQRSNDVLLTGQVRASFVDASDLQANAFRVVTERGTVYLMGRVTAREADRATSIARQIPGVQRVVRVFEIVTPEQIMEGTSPAPAGTAPPGGEPAAAPAAPAPIPPASGGAVATPVR